MSDDMEIEVEISEETHAKLKAHGMATGETVEQVAERALVDGDCDYWRNLSQSWRASYERACLQRDERQDVIEEFVRTHPRLHREHATPEQQSALRELRRLAGVE